MSSRPMRYSAQQSVRLAKALLEEIERSPRPDITAAWALAYLARKSEQEVYLVDAAIDPLDQVERLATHTESAILRSFEDHLDDKRIRAVIVDFAIMILGYVPAAEGWHLTAVESLKAGRRAHGTR